MLGEGGGGLGDGGGGEGDGIGGGQGSGGDGGGGNGGGEGGGGEGCGGDGGGGEGGGGDGGGGDGGGGDGDGGEGGGGEGGGGEGGGGVRPALIHPEDWFTVEHCASLRSSIALAEAEGDVPPYVQASGPVLIWDNPSVYNPFLPSGRRWCNSGARGQLAL